MTELRLLERSVARVARQVRRRRMEFYGLRGALYGAVVATLPLLGKGLLGPQAPWIALAAVLAGALAGVLRGLTLALPPGEVARLVDRSLDLKDRVATALEWAGRPDRSPLVDLLVADAERRLEGFEGEGTVRRHWPPEWRLAPLPALALAALLLAPPIPLPTGVLPALWSGGEEESAEERAGKILAEDRPTAKRAPLQRVETMERNLAIRQGSQGTSQAGDLAALFKDTALAVQRPDFQSFLKKGDERLRLLEQVDRLPDLKRDFTQSEYKMVFQKRKQLFGGLRPDQISPQKLRELLEEMERLGRKGGNWAGDVGEGLEALEGGETDRAMEAMEKALSKLRAMEERGRDARGLRGGREDERRGGRGRGERGGGADYSEPDFGEGEGLFAGRGRNPNPKGDPTGRLRSDPYDAAVEGESRSGRKEGYDTNLLGKGANVPSRLQYLGVFGQYRTMMEEAMAREQVPRDYQSHVKEYFEALEERR
jgi:hypothetical protein